MVQNSPSLGGRMEGSRRALESLSCDLPFPLRKYPNIPWVSIDPASSLGVGVNWPHSSPPKTSHQPPPPGALEGRLGHLVPLYFPHPNSEHKFISQCLPNTHSWIPLLTLALAAGIWEEQIPLERKEQMLQIAPHFHTHTPRPTPCPTLADSEQQSRGTSGMTTSTSAPNQGEAVGSPL